MFRSMSVVAIVFFSACTPGPQRASLINMESAPSPEECEAVTEPSGVRSFKGNCLFSLDTTGEVQELPPALPVSAGVAVGVSVGNGGVEPAQLVSGNLKLVEVQKRAVGLALLGGFSNFKDAKVAGGLAGYFELTPGNLRYEAGVCAGALWTPESGTPRAFVGVSVIPKF